MENKPFEPKHSYSGMNQPKEIRDELTMIENTVLGRRMFAHYDPNTQRVPDKVLDDVDGLREELRLELSEAGYNPDEVCKLYSDAEPSTLLAKPVDVRVVGNHLTRLHRDAKVVFPFLGQTFDEAGKGLMDYELSREQYTEMSDVCVSIIANWLKEGMDWKIGEFSTKAWEEFVNDAALHPHPMHAKLNAALLEKGLPVNARMKDSRQSLTDYALHEKLLPIIRTRFSMTIMRTQDRFQLCHGFHSTESSYLVYPTIESARRYLDLVAAERAIKKT